MTRTSLAGPERPDSLISDPAGEQLGGAAPTMVNEALTSQHFPAIYMASFLAVTLLAIVVNYLGNGTNLLPSPGFPSDSDRAWKARRLEALARSGSPPTAIVLGSSRVTCFETHYVEQLTGRRCFNCGVSVGCPVDYLTQFRFLLGLGIKPEILIIGVDELAFGDHSENDFYDLQLITHPGLFRKAPLLEELSIFARALKTITVQSTWRSVTNLTSKAGRLRPQLEDISPYYYDDGLSRAAAEPAYGPNHHKDLAAGIEAKAKFWSAYLDRPSKVERMRPQSRMVRYYRELMALAREHGIQVYVALLPVHPEYERQVFTPRLYEVRQELCNLLRDTCREFGCEYQDLSALKSFGGVAVDFMDGTHPTTRNTRRMLDVLLCRQSNHAGS
jgi:Protein of unknown function (DUF1574)